MRKMNSEKVAKFLVFAGQTFYPEGGMDDFRFVCYKKGCHFESVEKAIENDDNCFEWCHIVDFETFEVVRRGTVHEIYNLKNCKMKARSVWNWEDVGDDE